MGFKNPLLRQHFREPSGPEKIRGPLFFPTYKLLPKMSRHIASDATCSLDGGRRCWTAKLRDLKTQWCYPNTDGSPKHSPAWTDRIIFSEGPHRAETHTYRARHVDFPSDHAPVVALITLDIAWKP